MFKNRSRTVSIIIQDVSDDDIAGVVQEILETSKQPMDVLELRRKLLVNWIEFFTACSQKLKKQKSRQRKRSLTGPHGKLVIPDSVLTVIDQPTASFVLAVSITNRGNIRKLRQPLH
jgi:hypothetical protein|mmetsp:Transcript_31638/g.57293  ORF Transcript_31638/g.57293 Transcript_31638/m.57293 type:complete len:117 (-) Transcript_31638:71-421(-)